MQRMIDTLSEMTKIQQYLKLALIKSPEIAARYAQATDNELDFSTAEMAKIASLEKEVEKKKSSGAGRKRSVDKTNDTCNQCDQKGHWKWDRDSNGKYICPKQQWNGAADSCDLDELVAQFHSEGFDEAKPSSIHHPEAIRFFKRFIADDQYVLDILNNGLDFHFVHPPSNYSEKNNKSALENLVDLRKIIDLWESQGKLFRVEKESLVNNPMSLIKQVQSCGTVKLRPVIDCSRYLNDLFVVEKIKLDDLNEMEKW